MLDCSFNLSRLTNTLILSDFVYVNQQLNKLCPKDKLPDLPPKKYFGSSTDYAFVEDRRVKLDLYLQQLTAIQTVWTTPVLVTFLDSPTNTLMYLWNFEKMRKMQKVTFYNICYMFLFL
jgi:hypothetical protein